MESDEAEADEIARKVEKALKVPAKELAMGKAALKKVSSSILTSNHISIELVLRLPCWRNVFFTALPFETTLSPAAPRQRSKANKSSGLYPLVGILLLK